MVKSQDINWVSDDLCLIEESTGIQLWGTVCNDMEFIANQLNGYCNRIHILEKEIDELKRNNDYSGF